MQSDEEDKYLKKKYKTHNVLKYNFSNSKEYVKRLVQSIPLDICDEKSNGLYKIIQSCITSKNQRLAPVLL